MKRPKDDTYVHLIGSTRTLCCGRRVWGGITVTRDPALATCPLALGDIPALEVTPDGSADYAGEATIPVPGGGTLTGPAHLIAEIKFLDFPDETPRYTLDEARPIILGELCRSEGGHDIESETVRTGAGPVHLIVRCTRCGATFSEDPR